MTPRLLSVAFFAFAATPAVSVVVNSPAYWALLGLNTLAILSGLYLWTRGK